MSSRNRSTVETTFHLCAIVGATNAFGVYLFSVLIPEMRASLGLGLDFVGIASGLGQAGVMVSSVLCGLAVPRVRPLRLVFVSVTVTAFCLIGMAVVSRPELIALLLLLLGAAAAAVWVSVVVVTKEAVPQAHQGKALGIMASTGTALGVFLCGLFVPILVQYWGWRSAWVVVGIVTLGLALAGYVRLRALEPANRSADTGLDGHSSWIPAEVLKTTTVVLLLIALLNGAAFIPFQTYLTSLLQTQFGWSVAEAKTSWSLIGIGSIAGGPLFGYLSDRISARSTLAIAYFILSLAIVGTFLGKTLLLVYPSALVFGLAYGAVFGQLAAYITKTQGTAGAAFMSGATYVAFGVGSTAGNYALGQVADSTGDLIAGYSVIAIGVAALFVLTLLLSPDGRPKTVSPEAVRT